MFGWTCALLLADINTSPKAMEALLARGYDFGESRVIAGYHWQSDVDAGRMAGNVLYQMIRNNERFIGQLEKARAEFKAKQAEATKVASTRAVAQAEGTARIYRLDGTPASESSRGLLIQDNKKVVRK